MTEPPKPRRLEYHLFYTGGYNTADIAKKLGIHEAEAHRRLIQQRREVNAERTSRYQRHDDTEDKDTSSKGGV